MTKDKELSGGSRITYRLATSEDFVKWYGARQKYGAKAYIFFKGDVPVGLGGYKIQDGMFILFSEIKENVILDKLTIFRAGKIIMSLIDELNVIVYASSKNQRLCEVFGGKKIEEDTYVWQN